MATAAMSAYPAWYPGPTQAAFSMDTTLQPPAGPFSFYKPFSDRQLSKLPEGSRNLSSSAGFLDPSTSSAPGPCHDSLQRATAQLPSSQQQQQQQGPAPAPPGGSFQDAPAAATTLLRKDKAQQADHSGRLCEFMAQMICYIWFSDSPLTSAHSVTPSRSPTLAYAPLHSSPLSGRHGHGRGQDSQPHSAQLSQAMEEHLRKLSELASSDIKEEAETSGLRLAPQSRFRAFVRDVLNTTQVSQSVVLLALLYVYRLKARHPSLKGQDGSEYRLTITALMLANKFLDDHTYTNKTWSEISGIALRDVTKMEVEFWLGLQMRIFVSERDFLQWLRMLEAMAESRSHTLFRRDRQIARRKAAAHQQALATIHHRSRPSTGQHWSPVSGHAEEPFAYTTPPLQPALFSPQGMPTPTSLQQVPSPSIASPFSRAPAPDFGWAASQPHLLALPPSHPASRSNSPDMRPSYGRPSSSSSNSSFSSIKRAFGALQTASPRGSDDSPHRPSKRFAAAPYQDDFAYNARASLSPLEDLHHRRSRRPSRDLFEDATSAAPRPVPVNDVQWYQAQPAHQQHVAPLQGYHSVFDSAAVAPNTLLAPFAGYQDTNVQSRQNLLSYYSLASGKDRGILGVHLPPPIPSAHPAYAPISESRRPSATLPTDMRSVASHGMVPAATTTPYPTPAFEFDRVQSYPVNPYPPSVWAGGLSSASPVPAGPDFGTHHVEPLGQTHASTHRAPFNNAQGCYMPHWAPPHSSHMQ